MVAVSRKLYGPRIVASILSALLLASSTLTVAAQPAETPPLTIDSVLNAAYLSPSYETMLSGGVVQLTDGNYPSNSHRKHQPPTRMVCTSRSSTTLKSQQLAT